MRIPRYFQDFNDEPTGHSAYHPIVTILGSPKFNREMNDVYNELVIMGWRPFSNLFIGVTGKRDNIDETNIDQYDLSAILDALKNRIKMSKAVCVVNKNSMLDTITMCAVKYARSLYVPVYYIDQEGHETAVKEE